MTALVAAIISASLAAVLGYSYRRQEYLRDERLQACSEMAAAFHAAAGTGADLLSVHMQTGYPYKLSPKAWDEEQRRAMTEGWNTAFKTASTARARFEVAYFRFQLVANAELREAGQALPEYLSTSLYDGEPWSRESYPSAKRNPVDIQPAASEAARSFVERPARVLWRRAVPKPSA